MAVVVLPALLVLAVLTGWVRQERALPGAAKELRLAVDQAAALMSCLQGVQDEVFVPGIGELTTEVAVAAARDRLSSCDTRSVEAQVAQVDVPPAAALSAGRQREARRVVAGAVASLQRLVLEAEGTGRAMAADLGGKRAGELVALGYRATEADYERANVLLVRAEALLSSS